AVEAVAGARRIDCIDAVACDLMPSLCTRDPAALGAHLQGNQRRTVRMTPVEYRLRITCARKLRRLLEARNEPVASGDRGRNHGTRSRKGPELRAKVRVE